nr:rhomboid family intramembrane serine protease [Candidatus Melainabacteria bacterium]
MTVSNDNVAVAASRLEPEVAVTFDFTVSRQSDTVIKVIFWLTFAFFVLSVPTQWLSSWAGLEVGDKIALWMYTTFGVNPSRLSEQPWTLVTHMFMHGGVLHFVMNMLTLYVFYVSAKEFFPNKTWLIIFFSAGIGGALLQCLMNSGEGLMVGASGGV